MNLHVLNAPCNEKITNDGTSHMMNLCCLYFRDNPNIIQEEIEQMKNLNKNIYADGSVYAKFKLINY